MVNSVLSCANENLNIDYTYIMYDYGIAFISKEN